MKILARMIIALVFALLFSIVSNGTASYSNFLFNGGLWDEAGEAEKVKQAILQYNINSASFYNTAGFLAGIDEIPAHALIKRRLFKDIRMLVNDGYLMVFDKDSIDIRKVKFKRKDLVVVQTFEVWAMNLQKASNREPVTTVKAVEVGVRYVLHKEPFLDKGLKWIVYEVDVYAKGDRIPPFETVGSI